MSQDRGTNDDTIARFTLKQHRKRLGITQKRKRKWVLHCFQEARKEFKYRKGVNLTTVAPAPKQWNSGVVRGQHAAIMMPRAIQSPMQVK